MYQALLFKFRRHLCKGSIDYNIKTETIVLNSDKTMTWIDLEICIYTVSAFSARSKAGLISLLQPVPHGSETGFKQGILEQTHVKSIQF